ncbi:MAG: SCO family protein [Alphaproteobacteria bacterium]|nr:SCO family protein [Alphaproteobacteria bacterium]MCD8570879.1 SCO family protein [Alphaproteobacteria bacterium]
MKHRIFRTFILCLMGLIIGGLIGLWQMQQEGVTQTRTASNSIAGVQVGGPFSLSNQDGARVSESDFSDKYKLIYFGFTYCPAICPTELQKITRALKLVEKDEPEALDNLAPIFITVDPERDTPDVLKDYLTLFDPRFTGLTGSVEEIEAVKKAYRIYAAKVEEEGMSDYSMDHSSFIYFLAPDETVLGIYRVNDTAEIIAADIQNNIQ